MAFLVPLLLLIIATTVSVLLGEKQVCQYQLIGILTSGIISSS